MTPAGLQFFLGGVSAPPPIPTPTSGHKDLLRTGLSWLTDQLSTNVSENVVYARDGIGVEVLATFGNKLLKIEDDFGNIRYEHTDCDFLIKASLLDLGSGQITPERGDLIYILAGVNVEVFEVFPFNGEAAWRWSDPHRSMLRIHAKWIDTEPAT